MWHNSIRKLEIIPTFFSLSSRPPNFFGTKTAKRPETVFLTGVAYTTSQLYTTASEYSYMLDLTGYITLHVTYNI